MKLPFAAILLLAASTLAFSQTTKAKDHKPAEKKTAAAAPAQAMPKPSAEEEKLIKAFGGKWTVDGNTEASPAGPAEKTAGTESCHKGPGGFSVICDANMKFDRMGPFMGHGVMYWDAEAKNYTGTWCDNLGPCSTQGTGAWDGDKLVFNSEMKMNGQSAKMRQTYSDITPTSYKFQIEMGDPSGELKPWMTLNYKRASGAPATTEKK
jgi:Protein of unknown function (DUF1579)